MRSILPSLFTLTLATTAATAQTLGIQLTTGIDGGYEWSYDPMFVPRGGITVEAWVTFDDASVPTGLFYWPTIARMNVNPNQETFNFRVSSSNVGNRDLQFIVRKPTGTLYAATYRFAPGEFAAFTHLAATYDGRIIRLFKNGAEVAIFTTPTTDRLVDNGGVLRVGNGDPVNPGRESWNGILDELRIWPMARSAAEILATRDLNLGAMPGNVLTFPLDFPIEIGHGLIGTSFGSVTLVNGAPGLTPLQPAANLVGQATSTCATPIAALLGSPARIGNQGFTIWCTGGPLPAASPFGLAVAGSAPAQSGQPPLLGVHLAFDAATLLAQFLLLPPTDLLGNARFPLPLPNAPNLIGGNVVFQFGFVDSQCGPLGYSASNGVLFTVQ